MTLGFIRFWYNKSVFVIILTGDRGYPKNSRSSVTCYNDSEVSVSILCKNAIEMLGMMAISRSFFVYPLF